MKSEGIWRKKDLLGPLGKNISPLRFCFISPGQQKERALSLASLAIPQYELVRLLWKQQPNEELRTRGCRSLLPATESRDRHQGIVSSPASLQISLTFVYGRQVVTQPELFSFGRKEWMDL